MRLMYKTNNRFPAILTKKFYKTLNKSNTRTTSRNTKSKINKNTINKLKNTFKSPSIKTSKNKKSLWTFLGFKPLAKK
jgi:hypothetical protein